MQKGGEEKGAGRVEWIKTSAEVTAVRSAMMYDLEKVALFIRLSWRRQSGHALDSSLNQPTQGPVWRLTTTHIHRSYSQSVGAST